MPHFETAFERVEQQIQAIQSSAFDFAKALFQGTLHPDILEELRYVRHNKAVFSFMANEDRKVV